MNNNFVIFLDWDGVFRATGVTTVTGNMVNPTALALLNDLIRHCQCGLVISSMHRGGRSKDELETELKEYGFENFELHEDFKTRQPVKPNERRGEQIRDWLRAHKEVKDYMIIDDDTDLLKGQWPHLVWVDGQEGFGFKNYRVAIQLFDQRIQ